MHFHSATLSDIQSRTRTRPHETKIGERILVQAELESSGPRFVLFGVKEDLGARANLGLGGAATAWDSFLNAFLNVQDTPFLRGQEIQLLGHFDFTVLPNHTDVTVMRQQVEQIDSEVSALVSQVVGAGKIPLIIGGSHAGAYANLKGAALGMRKNKPTAMLNCINLDAHSDYRIMEGRHSGNGFRYAQEEGYLQEYSILGLHENYTPENILQDLQEHPGIQFSTWEDIFLREKLNFAQALEQSIAFTQRGGNRVGIELDVDCIENVLSSALTPSGISTQQARNYLYQTAQRCEVAYLHICEAASNLENGLENRSTGKLLSYLLSDFVKGYLERNP
ncbi:MAG: formimidoylglutamase [Haliscomenobacter sp.]|uniref:formimidoylglutamase n=1 Tax=Haliscomenobacter sp. TaxID=2717303 RepID=UPI0029BC98AC|nr:formimidoylglutamase [Haliscomenobacter sp.]MDX2066981.1 formimidoylglutamase [Haliscomenobacter sp.]